MQLQINLSFDSHFRIPTVDIGIDDTLLSSGAVQPYYEFNVTFNKGKHTFWIKHYNKQPHETSATNDTHVYIKSILIDEIDLDQFDYCRLTHRGRFYPDYNADYVKDCIINNIELPEYISPNHYLGHNGIWKLDFEIPTMNWIIKEQNPSGMNLEDTMFSSSRQILLEIKDLFKI